MKKILGILIIALMVLTIFVFIGRPSINLSDESSAPTITSLVSEASALREQAYEVIHGRAANEKYNALIANGIVEQYSSLQNSASEALLTDSESPEAQSLIRELGYLGNLISASESAVAS